MDTIGILAVVSSKLPEPPEPPRPKTISVRLSEAEYADLEKVVVLKSASGFFLGMRSTLHGVAKYARAL